MPQNDCPTKVRVSNRKMGLSTAQNGRGLYDCQKRGNGGSHERLSEDHDKKEREAMSVQFDG